MNTENKQVEYGVKWAEFNQQDRRALKKKIFKTEKARDRFVEKLGQKDNFASFEAWIN